MLFRGSSDAAITALLDELSSDFYLVDQTDSPVDQTYSSAESVASSYWNNPPPTTTPYMAQLNASTNMEDYCEEPATDSNSNLTLLENPTNMEEGDQSSSDLLFATISPLEDETLYY
jgi:hypothetical protein